MFLHKLMTATAMLLVLGLLGAGAGFLALARGGAQPAPNQPAGAPAQAGKDEPAAGTPLQKMTRHYALPDGEVLRRVAPPFPPFRMDYYTKNYADQAKAIPRGPTVMTFRWKDGRLKNWSMTFSGTNDDGVTVPALLEWLAGIYPQEIEGDEALLKEEINGDWVVREGTPAEKVVPRLEEILRHEGKLPVLLALRDVERKVIVLRGTYRPMPLPGHDKGDIQLYGKDLVPDSGAGGGSGTFPEFLAAAGSFMGRRLVSEVEGVPPEVGWRYHKRNLFTEQEAKEDTDPDGVLKHIADQTGLTFKEETRKVRVLFVTRAPGQPK
jgi:hypothetical protein